MNRRRVVLTGAWVGGIVGIVLMGSIGLGHESDHEASTNMMTVDGQRVPDIGPLPTVIPQPAANLNYAAKVSLGKQLMSMGDFQKTTPFLAHFAITLLPDLRTRIRPQWAWLGSGVGVNRLRSITRPLINFNFGMVGPAR